MLDEIRNLIPSVQKALAKRILATVLEKFNKNVLMEVHTVVNYALDLLVKKSSPRPLGTNEAAMKIQKLYRQKHKPKGIVPKTIQYSPYKQVIDSDTGQIYYYNELTGETAWDIPT